MGWGGGRGGGREGGRKEGGKEGGRRERNGRDNDTQDFYDGRLLHVCNTTHIVHTYTHPEQS